MRTFRAARSIWILIVPVALLLLYIVPGDENPGSFRDFADALQRGVLSLQVSAILAGAGTTVLILIIGMLLVALITGRIFCSLLCPAGMVQELFHKIGRFFKLSRLAFVQSRRKVILWLLLGICGLIGIAATPAAAAIVDFFDPIGLFGRLAAGLGGVVRSEILGVGSFTITPAVLIAMAISIIFLAVIPLVKGRWFCDRLCPVGALLGTLAAHSQYGVRLDRTNCVSCGTCVRTCPERCIDSSAKTLDFSSCVVCSECTTKCPKGAIAYGAMTNNPGLAATRGNALPVQSEPDRDRRRFLIMAGTWMVGGMFLASRQLGQLSAMPYVLAAENIPDQSMPPGAGDWRQFRQRCVSCWSCVQACPAGILQPSDSWRTPFMDYERGYCQHSCKKCSDVCPTSAIQKLTLHAKQTTRIGISTRISDECYFCGLCSDSCPTGALTVKSTGVPVPIFNEALCIGCGACSVVCQTQAYEIRPLSRQESIA